MTKRVMGDMCQNRVHPITSTPVVFPCDVMEVEPGQVKALYRCRCGAEWPCWWGYDISVWENAEDAA